MSDNTPHSEELLERIEALLRAWRPAIEPGEAQLEIPLLTETLSAAQAEDGEDPPPFPAGLSLELLQAHLAVAAEQVMRELYRDLTAELNDTLAQRMRETINQAVDEAVARSVKGLRRQILISVAESLTKGIERLGQFDPAYLDPASSNPLSRS